MNIKKLREEWERSPQLSDPRAERLIAALEAKVEKLERASMTLDTRFDRCDDCIHDDYPRCCDRLVKWAQWDTDKSTVECDMPVSYCSNFDRKHP